MLFSNRSLRDSGLLLAVLAVFSLGCESLIKAIADKIAEALIAAIEADGGKAILVKPGQAFSLEIDDPNNPLYGTKVDLPADALPETIESALLSIERSNYDRSTEGQRRVGVPAEIRLRPYVPEREEFSDAADDRITLRTEATVRVPYAVTQVEENEVTSVVVGHLVSPDDVSLTVLPDTVVDSELGRVSGGTLTFSPFMAIVLAPVTVATEEESIVEFTGRCVERQDFAPADTTTDAFYESVFENGYRTRLQEFGPEPAKATGYDRIWYYNANKDLTFETEIDPGLNYTGINITLFRNASGQVTSEVNSVYGTTTYGYNGNGKLETATAPSGDVITYIYSGDRLVSTETQPDVGDPYCKNFNYDQNGNLVSAIDYNDCTGTDVYAEVTYTNCPGTIIFQHYGVPR